MQLAFRTGACILCGVLSQIFIYVIETNETSEKIKKNKKIKG